MADEEKILQIKKEGPIITQGTAEELDSLFEEREKESLEKVEAAMFISGKFLNIHELVMLTDVNPIMLKEILHRLEKKYSTGALRLINRNNSWKMDVSEKYHYMVNKLATGTAEFTRAEQETLAVIAYKQPIKQSVVIKIRGNKAYDHIAKFEETGLVVGKRIGHTKELSLSEDFYEYFSIQQSQKQKEELESLEEVKESE
jgi:segregation and condensation protein B